MRVIYPEWMKKAISLFLLATVLMVAVTSGMTAAAQHSPLVALAKRTNRKATKHLVITNETVAASRGRLAVSAGAPPTGLEARPDPSSPGATAQAGKVTEPAPAQRVAVASRAVASPVAPDNSGRDRTPRTVATIPIPDTAPTLQPQSTARYLPGASTASVSKQRTVD